MEFNRILVPVGGNEADDEAMRLACTLAKKNKAKIFAVYVITIKRSLPLEAEVESEIRSGESILENIETIAEEEDYEVETDLLQSREVGPTIVDEVAERNIDLVIMGIVYGTRFGQFSLGNVVPYVLKNALCPVILFHQSTM